MISSEVQRTLVKSPPELWTELSDPESLARHLGELGEITITRTEPENLVEWEAEGTTGTVEIAASGWGTRVRLTVLRELTGERAEPQDGGEGQAVSPESPEPQPTATAGEDPEPQAPGDAQAEEDEAPSQAKAEIVPQEAAPELEAAATLDGGPRADPGTELKPAPATEAARRAAGWPSVSRTPGPAVESDLRAAEALDGPPAEPDGLHQWAAQSAEAEVAGLGDEPAAEEEAPTEPEQPKLGLFARLFGRRRGRAKKPPQPEELPGVSEEAETMPLAAPASLAAGREPADPEPAAIEGAFDDAEWQESGVPGEAPAGTEFEQAEAEAEAQDLGAPAEELDEPAGAEPGTGDAAVPVLAESDPDAAGQEPGFSAHQAAGTTLHAGEPATDSLPETPVADLAAELRAAEEVAAEQVEAVLTAVLDRLGSAHHRPFSRS